MPRPARAEPSTAPQADERILAAALEIFSERGFDGSRTRDIAARAGVTLGLLQYYFGTKLQLWKAAVDRAFEQLASAIGAEFDDPSPGGAREKLRRMIRAQTRFVGRHPEFARLMHDEGKRRGPRMRWLVDRHVKSLFEGMQPLIEACQKQGILADDIPAIHFIYAFVGAIDVIFHQAEECKRVSGLDPAQPSAIEAHARAVELLFLGPHPQETSP